MKKYKKFVIPNNIEFLSWIKQKDLNNDLFSCRMITNLKLQDNYFRSMKIDSNCNISCCKCIFFKDNWKERFQYWKSINQK